MDRGSCQSLRQRQRPLWQILRCFGHSMKQRHLDSLGPVVCQTRVLSLWSTCVHFFTNPMLPKKLWGSFQVLTNRKHARTLSSAREMKIEEHPRVEEIMEGDENCQPNTSSTVATDSVPGKGTEPWHWTEIDMKPQVRPPHTARPAC